MSRYTILQRHIVLRVGFDETALKAMSQSHLIVNFIKLSKIASFMVMSPLVRGYEVTCMVTYGLF